MSTFGKKSLTWWKYNNPDISISTRFQHTPLDVQLKIIERWYPIGTKVTNWNYLIKKWGSEVFKILSYEIINNSWCIHIELIPDREHPNVIKYRSIPTNLLPLEEERIRIIRGINVDKNNNNDK